MGRVGGPNGARRRRRDDWPFEPTYTLAGQRIPERDAYSFTAPGLSGARGAVYQRIDPRDFTTTELTAHATWYDRRPTAGEKRRAARTRERLIGWVLLTGERSTD